MVNVFEFTDYREYLKACFEERKLTDTRFSHRWLARRLDLSTSNFILLVMQGKRNLSSALSIRLSEVLGHSAKEAEYFENLVGFCQARSAREKERYFGRMSALRKKAKVGRVEESQYEYYSKWYCCVVRSLIDMCDFRGDYAWLARTVRPAITVREARQAVRLLEKLGMVKRKPNGAYALTEKNITTGKEITGLAVANFHVRTAELAARAVRELPREERNVTGLTLGISRATYDRICERIGELQEEIIETASADDKADRVYQLNFQIFPMSSRNGKARGGTA
jgi:uncharacterized protein (TIGR02147 family)